MSIVRNPLVFKEVDAFNPPVERVVDVGNSQFSIADDLLPRLFVGADETLRLFILVGCKRLVRHTHYGTEDVNAPMNGTTVVLKPPDPTASSTHAVITPLKAVPLPIAMGSDVANRTVAPMDSILSNY